jgi:hypothetical protein
VVDTINGDDLDDYHDILGRILISNDVIKLADIIHYASGGLSLFLALIIKYKSFLSSKNYHVLCTKS